LYDDDPTLACVFKNMFYSSTTTTNFKATKEKIKFADVRAQTQHLKKPKEIDANPIIKIFALNIR
jgi:hypothetical protein